MCSIYSCLTDDVTLRSLCSPLVLLRFGRNTRQYESEVAGSETAEAVHKLQGSVCTPLLQMSGPQTS